MNLSIAHLHQQYKEKALSPNQLVDAVLDRCQQFKDHNIWISLLSKQQIQPYIDALLEHTPDDLPLYGIPFAIKDNIDLAGVNTTAACSAFSYMAEKSAFVVEQLINAGAIPIGKTNMDQFATGLVGTRSPEPWGACRNAFDPDFISGGSSAGSAVAVALGLVSFSLGTDTAGSGRVPASFNNLVGLKPSRGLLSMTGVVPACRSLDCVSIFALNTDDANTVFEQAAVYDEQDAYARHNPFSNNTRHYRLPNESFKFAVPREEQLEFFGNASAQSVFNQSIEQLITMGGIKQEIDFTPFQEAARLLYEGPWVAERYIAIEDIISNKPEELLPVIGHIIGGAKGRTAVDAFKAEYQMQKYRQQSRKFMAGYDFLVTPTTGTIYTIDEVLNEPIKLNSNLGYYTNYMNLLDYACVAIPAGFLNNGLPWGISLVAEHMQDRRLLSFANRWQQQLQIPPGKLDYPLTRSKAKGLTSSALIPIVVCGAHLDGLTLNWQLLERGASLQETTSTSEAYRMYVIEGSIQRPGLIRDEINGRAIEIEIWQVPREEFGSFVAAIPQPLAIGKVETSDGRWLPGFVCEAYATSQARDISEYGGWRGYITSR